MTTVTVWIAYNTDDECFASHEGAKEAIDGLVEAFGYAEGSRVIEFKLTLPSVKPLEVKAVVADKDGPVSVTVS